MTKNDLADIVLILGAVIAIIVVLLIGCGCESVSHGPDTPRKFDTEGNPNFGAKRLFDLPRSHVDFPRSHVDLTTWEKMPP